MDDRELEKIISQTTMHRKQHFLCKWKGQDQVTYCETERINNAYPQLVIKFYEDRLQENNARPNNISDAKFQEILQCPVCLQVPKTSPIYQCLNGHIVCNQCHPKLTTCPVCRNVLGKIRSIISEKMIKQVRFGCKFATEGCPIQLPHADLLDHESKCIFGEYVECPLSCKGEILALPNMIQHMKQVHEKDLNENMRKINASVILQEDNREFYLHYELGENNNNVAFNLVLLGSEEVAAKYSFQIHIVSKTKRLLYASDVESVIHFPDPWQCLVVPSSLMNENILFLFMVSKKDETKILKTESEFLTLRIEDQAGDEIKMKVKASNPIGKLKPRYAGRMGIKDLVQNIR